MTPTPHRPDFDADRCAAFVREYARVRCWELTLMLWKGVPADELEDLALECCALCVEANEIQSGWSSTDTGGNKQ
jgi:hypothetical protein